MPNNYLSAAGKTNGSRAEYFQEFPNPRNHMPSPEGWKNAKRASVTSRPTVLPTQNALVVAQVEGDVFIDRLQLQGGRLQGCSLRGCDQDPSDPAAGCRLRGCDQDPSGPAAGRRLQGACVAVRCQHIIQDSGLDTVGPDPTARVSKRYWDMCQKNTLILFLYKFQADLGNQRR